MGSFHFPHWKIFFQVHLQILNILGNVIPQPFMLSLKCDYPLLCEFPILFSKVKLKLGHKFSQLIQRFNIWILKCLSGTVYISKFFSIHKRDGKFGFLNSLDYIFTFFPRRQPLPPPPFPGAKRFFPHKIIKHQFALVNEKWDFSLFIEKDIMDIK